MKSKSLQVLDLERSLHELAHSGDNDMYVNVEEQELVDTLRILEEIES